MVPCPKTAYLPMRRLTVFIIRIQIPCSRNQHTYGCKIVSVFHEIVHIARGTTRKRGSMIYDTCKQKAYPTDGE